MHLLALPLLATLALAHPFSKRSITCLAIGANATATWTNAAGKNCTWTGVVGSNFGAKDDKAGDYGCIGRCGAGCHGMSAGNVYTQECFSHDVCSWFAGKGKDPNDPNCGHNYKMAVDDFFLGGMRGCTRENPDLPVVKPTGEPVCV